MAAIVLMRSALLLAQVAFLLQVDATSAPTTSAPTSSPVSSPTISPSPMTLNIGNVQSINTTVATSTLNTSTGSIADITSRLHTYGWAQLSNPVSNAASWPVLPSVALPQNALFSGFAQFLAWEVTNSSPWIDGSAIYGDLTTDLATRRGSTLDPFLSLNTATWNSRAVASNSLAAQMVYRKFVIAHNELALKIWFCLSLPSPVRISPTNDPNPCYGFTAPSSVSLSTNIEKAFSAAQILVRWSIQRCTEEFSASFFPSTSNPVPTPSTSPSPSPGPGRVPYRAEVPVAVPFALQDFWSQSSAASFTPITKEFTLAFAAILATQNSQPTISTCSPLTPTPVIPTVAVTAATGSCGTNIVMPRKFGTSNPPLLDVFQLLLSQPASFDKLASATTMSPVGMSYAALLNLSTTLPSYNQYRAFLGLSINGPDSSLFVGMLNGAQGDHEPYFDDVAAQILLYSLSQLIQKSSNYWYRFGLAASSSSLSSLLGTTSASWLFDPLTWGRYDATYLARPRVRGISSATGANVIAKYDNFFENDGVLSPNCVSPVANVYLGAHENWVRPPGKSSTGTDTYALQYYASSSPVVGEVAYDVYFRMSAGDRPFILPSQNVASWVSPQSTPVVNLYLTTPFSNTCLLSVCSPGADPNYGCQADCSSDYNEGDLLAVLPSPVSSSVLVETWPVYPGQAEKSRPGFYSSPGALPYQACACDPGYYYDAAGCIPSSCTYSVSTGICNDPLNPNLGRSDYPANLLGLSAASPIFITLDETIDASTRLSDLSRAFLFLLAYDVALPAQPQWIDGLWLPLAQATPYAWGSTVSYVVSVFAAQEAAVTTYVTANCPSGSVASISKLVFARQMAALAYSYLSSLGYSPPLPSTLNLQSVEFKSLIQIMLQYGGTVTSAPSAIRPEAAAPTAFDSSIYINQGNAGPQLSAQDLATYLGESPLASDMTVLEDHYTTQNVLSLLEMLFIQSVAQAFSLDQQQSAPVSCSGTEVWPLIAGTSTIFVTPTDLFSCDSTFDVC